MLSNPSSPRNQEAAHLSSELADQAPGTGDGTLMNY